MQCQGQPDILRPALCSLLTTRTNDVPLTQALQVNCLVGLFCYGTISGTHWAVTLSGASSYLSAALLHFVPQKGKS